MTDRYKSFPLFLIALTLSQFSFGLFKEDDMHDPGPHRSENADPKAVLIKQYIEDEIPIVVHKKSVYNLLERPFYDDMYNAVIGNLKAYSPEESLPKECLIIACKETESHLGLDYIYASSMISVQPYKKL